MKDRIDASSKTNPIAPSPNPFHLPQTKLINITIILSIEKMMGIIYTGNVTLFRLTKHKSSIASVQTNTYIPK